VLADGYTYEPNGLIYKDFELGSGDAPSDGQQVVFNYSAYNEAGGTIDSSYRQVSSSAACAHAASADDVANVAIGAPCGDAPRHRRHDPGL
jgi:hypothetical protein